MIFKKDAFTIPNLLSLLRLALIPVYATIYLDAGKPRLAAGILAFSCLTDLLDGLIARRLHMVSLLGKFLDPLADKITQLAVLLCLSTRYPLVKSLIPILLTKEILQCILAFLHFRNGKMLDGALWTGKISTAVLFSTLILLMLFPGLGNHTVRTFVLVDGFFLILALASYLKAFLGDHPKFCDT